MMPEILTVQQAARYLQLDFEVVLRRVKLGEIPAAQIDGEWRLRRARLDGWVDEMSDLSAVAFNKLLRDTRRAAKQAGIKTDVDVDRLVQQVRQQHRKRHQA